MKVSMTIIMTGSNADSDPAMILPWTMSLTMGLTMALTMSLTMSLDYVPGLCPWTMSLTMALTRHAVRLKKSRTVARKTENSHRSHRSRLSRTSRGESLESHSVACESPSRTDSHATHRVARVAVSSIE